jgi:predicted acyl esterase
MGSSGLVSGVGERREVDRAQHAYEFTIKMHPTSNVFKRGHRIRIDISSSNFPRST